MPEITAHGAKRENSATVRGVIATTVGVDRQSHVKSKLVRVKSVDNQLLHAVFYFGILLSPLVIMGQLCDTTVTHSFLLSVCKQPRGGVK